MGIFVFDLVKAFADSISASITTVTNNVTDLSTSTDTSVANLQNFTISTQSVGSRKPTWVAPYPIADVTFPDAMNLVIQTGGNTGTPTAGTSHTHSLNVNGAYASPALWPVNQNASMGGYITITDAAIMNVVQIIGGKTSGTLNNNFLEVFRENSDTSLTRISSTNVSASLLVTDAYIEVPLNAPQIVQPGERYMVRLRNSSTVAGVADMAALQLSNLAPKVGFATSGSTLTAQTSYTAAEVATAKTIGTSALYLPWAMLANSSPTASDVSFSDDFNRSQFGYLWLLISSWATQLGITSSMAAYQGTTNGDQQALFIRSTSSNSSRVDFDVAGSASATTHAQCGGFIHANQDLSQMVYLGVTDNAVNIYSGSSGALTSRATISAAGNDGTWSLIYNVSTNTYTAYKNGVTVGLSWTDSGNLMTHGDGYRFGGVRVSRVSAVNAGTVDNWTLRDYS